MPVLGTRQPPTCSTLPPPAPPSGCRWKLNQSYLAAASMDQLTQLGKMTSLEHRRHVVDPTLLGLHEVGGGGGPAAAQRLPPARAAAAAAGPSCGCRDDCASPPRLRLACPPACR